MTIVINFAKNIFNYFECIKFYKEYEKLEIEDNMSYFRYYKLYKH